LKGEGANKALGQEKNDVFSATDDLVRYWIGGIAVIREGFIEGVTETI
jgi:hypothetical protein